MRRLPPWAVKVLGALATAAVIWGGGSLVSLRERVTAVEAEVPHVRDALGRIEGRLERLDSKVDRAFRRGGEGPRLTER